MKGEERRKQLLNILSSSNNPVSGGTLAKELNVSRQIIVQHLSDEEDQTQPTYRIRQGKAIP